MPLKLPSSAASNMFGIRRPGSDSRVYAPLLLKQRPNAGIGDVPIPGQLMRERSHVARTLNVVLTAQRIHAHAFATEIARCHRQVGHADHHRRALAVLGHAKTVVDRRIAGPRIQPGSSANLIRGHSGDLFHFFG